MIDKVSILIIDDLSILYNVYSKQISKIKKLSNVMDVHYSVTSVIDSKMADNNPLFGTPEETMELYGKIKDKEAKDKLEYDCELIKFHLISKQLIEEYKLFYDEAKKELSPSLYNRIKKLADDTLLETRTHAQKES